MPDYENGNNILLKRPEPGRPLGPPPPTKEVIIEKESKVDVDAIANAVVKAFGNKIPFGMSQGPGKQLGDGFDDSKTLERLADTMVIQKGDSESNFSDLGKVKENKKDQKDVQKTIDLLSDIDEGD